MKTLIKKNIIFIFVLLSTMAQGQITIGFVPTVHGQTIDGLAYATIVNSSGKELIGTLRIKVRHLKNGMVVTVLTPDFLIRTGASTINRDAYARSRFVFTNSSEAQILSQTQRFTEGEYEYCYELTAREPKSNIPRGVFENCFTHILQPTTPLFLINPANGDKTCNKRPVFTWQPPMPLLPGTRFRILVVPVNEGQTPIEAISNNLPVINQNNLSVSMLLYPVHAPDLVKDRKYAWQVTAYNNKTIVTKSEIWIVKVECDEPEKEIQGDSYREIKSASDGSYYAAFKVLRFSFENPYSSGELNYSIQNISDPGKEIKKLPKLTMQTGFNKYELDLSNNRSFKSGGQYLLIITGKDGRKYELRFLYEE